MIKSLRLKNFKSYKDSKEIPLAPLTVIVGCNNVGKSSVLQSLLLLAQTMADSSSSARLVTKGCFVDLGGFHDILHKDGSVSKRYISIEIEREPTSTIIGPRGEKLKQATKLGVSFSFREKTNKITVVQTVLSDESDMIVKCRENGQWEIRDYEKEYNDFVKIGLHHFLPIATLVKPPRSSKDSRIIDNVVSVHMQSNVWTHLFESIVHVAPLRSHVPFYGGIGRRIGTEAGPGGEDLFRVLASTEQMETTKKTLIDSVDYWMSKVFKTLHRIKLNHLDKAHFIRSLTASNIQSKVNVNIAAMGEGISQIIPIVATVLRTEQNDNLLIEQPEIHLHPSLQAHLADLFIDIVNLGKRQFIIETHSEHLLLRLRRRIAEGKIDPKKVAILFVEKQQEGESTIRSLKLNGHGHFEDWPEGFLDEAYKEAMALAMAQPIENDLSC